MAHRRERTREARQARTTRTPTPRQTHVDTSAAVSVERGAAPSARTQPPVAEPEGSRRRVSWTQSAGWVFVLMYAINTVNYLDRYVVVAAGPVLKAQFALRDRDLGFLATGFLLVYTLAAIPMGLLADRAGRARVAAAGVGLWSLMSTATAFTHTFGGLFFTRAAVGVGEASYSPAGVALLSAYYPREARARMLSRWQTAQIVGILAAFALTGLVLKLFGGSAWRLAFLMTGLPGVVLAVLTWRLADVPPHAASEDTAPVGVDGRTDAEGGRAYSSAHPRELGSEVARHHDELPTPDMRTRLRVWRDHLGAVLRIPTVRVMVALQALTFAVVTPAVTFLPIYLASHASPFHLSRAGATLVSGAIIVVGGLSGMLLGGYLSDWLGRRLPGGRMFTAAVGFALTLPCYVMMLLAPSLALFVVMGILAVVAMNLPAGPLTAALQDATPPGLRGSSVALTNLFSHILGDVWAVAVVGAVSTALGERANLALLFVGVPLLVLAILAAVVGTRVYARDLGLAAG